MRDASIAVLREIGVDTGGSNVQFAVNPEDGRLVVIEMNPRVSRSSALASKATGFPIAKVAAKLACGYTLDEIAERHHRCDAGIVRADHRLCGHQNSALHVREIPRHRSPADDLDEVGRRSHGHGPYLRRSAAKGLRSMETGLTGLNEIDDSRRRQPDGSMAKRASSVPEADAGPLRICPSHALRHVARRHPCGQPLRPWFLAAH